jgi:O-antigen ligase
MVVLVIGAAIFRLAKPIALCFGTERDFVRRRNLWFALTVAEFAIPNFWAFVLVAIPILIWGRRKDTNPTALYLLLLHAIPPITMDIPVVGINALFRLDNYRLLSFFVLIPTAWRLRQSKDLARLRALTAMDILLIAYGALQVALYVVPDMPDQAFLHDSATNVLRRAFLFYVDVYVLFFVVSRSLSNRRALAEAQAAFCVSCAVMAAVAIFESMRHWLLYVDIAIRWKGVPGAGIYLMRGNSLRALASSANSLSLGYLLAIAFGLWLYLQSHVEPMRKRIIVVLLYWLGLLATYSRGPWLSALVIYFAFAALSPGASSRLFKATGVALLVAAAISLSPLGERIASVTPFLGGSVDVGSIVYRQRLAARSWELIREHPFFGDQLMYSKMEDLRQGQGIIDLVNTYAEVALQYGLIGLALFVGFILVGLFKVYRLARATVPCDPDLALLGVSLVACILGTLVTFTTTSFDLGITKLYYVLGGFAAAYAHLARSPESSRC